MKIDHTQRAAWQNCQRLYFLRHLLGIRKATADSPGFSFGSAFHATTETVDFTNDIDLAMNQFTDMFNFPDDKVRTLTRARELLGKYAKFIKQKGWEFKAQPDNSMELMFVVDMDQDVEYCGKVDRLLLTGDIAEYKTTYYLYNSGGNPLPYLQRWWGHNSIRGYAWAVEKLTGEKVNKCHLVGVGVYPQKPKTGEPYSCIETIPIPVLEWEKKQVVREVTKIATEIMDMAKAYNLSINSNFQENINNAFENSLHKYFFCNTSHCYYFNNPCQFVDLCTRDMPRGLLENNYMIDPFLPWENEALSKDGGEE